jgi:transposase-like protein
VVSRDTGEHRFWGCDHADTRTCHDLIAENVPVARTILYTDEWQSYRGSHTAHATVCHSTREWARDDDHDGDREVHCNTCEGAGAALRTYLRAFRGLHKQYLHLYVATYEAMVNAKRVTSHLIRRMCVGARSPHTSLIKHRAEEVWLFKLLRLLQTPNGQPFAQYHCASVEDAWGLGPAQPRN